MVWYVYILLCIDNTLYTGISNDVQKRLKAHERGTGAKYTKSHKPVKLIYTEQHATRGDALKREFEVKSWSRQEKITTLKLHI